MTIRRAVTLTSVLGCTLVLGACKYQNDPDPVPEDEATEEPATEPTQTASIIREDANIEVELPAMEPLSARISFDDGGSDLTETALAELAAVLESRQMGEGGPVVISGHTDSGGNDQANLRSSETRANAVKEWLVDNGVAEDRLTVVALGEQNPAKPNANADGTPNEENRAFNRRVMIDIAVSEEVAKQQAEAERPTLIEQVTAED